MARPEVGMFVHWTRAHDVPCDYWGLIETAAGEVIDDDDNKERESFEGFIFSGGVQEGKHATWSIGSDMKVYYPPADGFPHQLDYKLVGPDDAPGEVYAALAMYRMGVSDGG